MTREEIQDIEIQLLLEALRLRYGYDFRNYVATSLRRRILQCLAVCHLTHISEIIPRLLHEGLFLERLLGVLTVSVTSLFRDPPVFLALRELTVPMLKTHHFVNIWIAGCATGEEVYTMAILLQEEGIYERAQIFATDINEESIHSAREGIYGADRWKEFELNYKSAGGRESLLNYCKVDHDQIQMDPELKKNVVFSNHNLATDGTFAEMNLILCRNVLIYFDESLQKKVFTLFHESLSRGGHLCLGTSESLMCCQASHDFKTVSDRHRIFMTGFKRGRKIGARRPAQKQDSHR
ncbi:MAG: protein-glutamate O-methyltransferase CheR [Magnetococcus sp. DMHC-1]|nr:protein-glutamate O-methyltransferase CheR [Magnetococcales bacterium]